MICSVGLTCVDIVSFLPKYPLEDSDQRCTSQSWERGGNASNNATVLACLGSQVEYFGTLANDNLLKFLQDDMESVGIKYGNCPIVDCGGNGPISVVICSEETGSRTIVHAKGNLPELSMEHFKMLNISQYSWMHFEGRNEAVLPEVLTWIHHYNKTAASSSPSQLSTSTGNESNAMIPNYKKVAIPISIEVEKCRSSLSSLLPFAHVVFVGKDFAKLQGAKDCVEAAKTISKIVCPGTVVVCPWGEHGAAYCIAKLDLQDADISKQDAYIPEKVIDSLGAGDTFNATVIHYLNKGLDVADCVNLGCKIASEKLKIRGFKGIKDISIGSD